MGKQKGKKTSRKAKTPAERQAGRASLEGKEHRKGKLGKLGKQARTRASRQASRKGKQKGQEERERQAERASRKDKRRGKASKHDKLEGQARCTWTSNPVSEDKHSVPGQTTQRQKRPQPH